MDKSISKFYLSAKKIWGSAIETNPLSLRDIDELLQSEMQKRLLNVLQPGKHYYMIFDVYNAALEYISPEITTVLGYSASDMSAAFFMDNIHPDDKSCFLNFEISTTDFFKALPLTKRGSYKSQHDYRVKTKGGNYIRLLHQIVPIDFDETNYYRNLVLHTDISHIKPEGIPCFSIIGLDDEPSYYNIQDTKVFTKSYDLFTKREREVLKSIIEGKSSKEIAEKLYVSLHTINTHRKNILSKANCKTPVDLVIKSINQGWV